MPRAAFGGSAAGCALASGAVDGQGEDRREQAGERTGRAGGPVPAVPAAGVSCHVGADEAGHGGERDEAGAGSGKGRSTGGGCGHDVMNEQECPGFLAGQFRGLAAQ